VNLILLELVVFSPKHSSSFRARPKKGVNCGREELTVEASEQVKQDMREKYDVIGKGILSNYQGGSTQGAGGRTEILNRAAQYWMEHKIRTAFALGRFSKADRLLEVGCTAGHYTLTLAREGYHVTGLDISAESIKAAQLQAGNLGLTGAEFVAGDAEDMKDIPDNSFDGVYSFSTLRYVPNPLQAVSEIRRVLKPAGRAVVDFPNKYCPWFEILKFLVGGERHVHDHTYSPRQVKRMMEQAGFANVEVKLIIFFAKQFPGFLTPLYKAVDAVCEHTPGLNYFAGIIMCKGEKAGA
jgi:SAM-dependent methyltransferase